MNEKELFEELQPNEYMLYCYIRFWRVEISGSINGLPSKENIANGMQISEVQASRLLKSLEKRGLI